MPNAIKYNVSAETLALKKGNFWIGTGDVGKGPTSSTGYYNGITPPSGGYTIYLNKASGGPSIYTVSTEAQLTGLTNTISVSTNLIKNNNGGNFADGTIAPFNGSYGTMPTVVDITNDKPYNGSTSTKAAKFVAGGGMNIATSPSPFTMTVGVTYTFSFWYRQTNSNNFYIGFNNQGGSGDVNGNFQAYSSYGMFPNPTQTWQRCSWTFTNVVDKLYFFIYSFNSVDGSECLMTEFTLTEGSMPGGPGLTTSGNCLNWFSTQTDKMIFNRDYPAIVTSGLTLNLDAGFSPSFATIPSNANLSTVTPWYDLSGNGNNGTLTNGPTYSSVNGGSIVFDGTDDYIDCGNSITFAQGFTLFILFKTTTSTLKVIAGKYSGASNDFWVGVLSNGTLRFSISLGGKREPTSTTVVNTGNWYLGTVIYNPSTFAASLYVNGNIEQTVIGDTLFLEPNPPFVLGNFPGYGYSLAFQGSIAISQVYNRALSDSEVLQNYNALKGRFGL
jgi:hypothetical protein